jgi:hypothetical protein
MKYLVRKALTLIIAASALSLGLAVGALAQDPGGRPVAAADPPQSVRHTNPQERTTLMQTARLSPEVKMPPLDAVVTAPTETATFGLG